MAAFAAAAGELVDWNARCVLRHAAMLPSAAARSAARQAFVALGALGVLPVLMAPPAQSRPFAVNRSNLRARPRSMAQHEEPMTVCATCQLSSVALEPGDAMCCGLTEVHLMDGCSELQCQLRRSPTEVLLPACRTRMCNSWYLCSCSRRCYRPWSCIFGHRHHHHAAAEAALSYPLLGQCTAAHRRPRAVAAMVLWVSWVRAPALPADTSAPSGSCDRRWLQPVVQVAWRAG